MDILIIDDDRSVRSALLKAFERAGYMAEAVESGLAAVAALQQRSYRVIVCDIRMPFLDGVSFYDELNESDPETARRVVFVTAFAKEPTVHAFLERTSNVVLEKPFELDELLAVVKRSLN